MTGRFALAIAAVAAVTVAAVVGSPPPGIPMIALQQGVNHHTIGAERIFVLREGSIITAFIGRSTAPGGEPIVYCPREGAFVAPTDTSLWTMRGEWVAGPAPRDLDRLEATTSQDLVVHIDPDELLRARGRSRGEISGEAGDLYTQFAAGENAGFCRFPVPAPPEQR